MLYSHGYCHPDYKSVQLLFEHQLSIGLEEHVQCCAYVNGKKVVDLYGSINSSNDSKYSATTTQNVYSSSKAVTSFVVALLESRGLLRYDQLVEDIWPEYASNGKKGTTIAMVMRHEAGLHSLTIPASKLTTANIKNGDASPYIANAKPRFPNGSTDVEDRANEESNGYWRNYHAMSRGWIVNEIVRRVDPQGRTIGEIIQEDINVPLGIDEKELFIGAKNEQQLNNIADISSIFAFSWKTWQSIVYPSFLGGQTVPLKSWWLKFWLALGIPLGHLVAYINENNGLLDLVFPGVTDLDDSTLQLPNFVNSKVVRELEMPSANGHSNARSLAKLATVVVEGGSIDGVRLMSQQAVKRAVGNGVLDSMGFGARLTNIDFHKSNTFTNAGWCDFSTAARDGWVGWLGIGGSLLQWYTKENYRIGFGFCGTMMHLIPTNERGLALQNELSRCCDNIYNKDQKKDGARIPSKL